MQPFESQLVICDLFIFRFSQKKKSDFAINGSCGKAEISNEAVVLKRNAKGISISSPHIESSHCEANEGVPYSSGSFIENTLTTDIVAPVPIHK